MLTFYHVFRCCLLIVILVVMLFIDGIIPEFFSFIHLCVMDVFSMNMFC